ncbi:MAG: ATP-dependent sacrificial sulfur transferase LarE [Phycisphaeraceae bacterium]
MTAPDSTPNRSVEDCKASLEQTIRQRGSMLVAYSGGIDSTLVAAVGRNILGRDHCIAVIGDSLSLPRRELREAQQIAADLDLQLITVNPAEQHDPNYRANAGDRCFYCKTNLYHALQQLSKERDIPWIANGTNTDDLGDHRPGLNAASDAGVISPLLEAGLNKQDIRNLALHMGLPNADKPAAACLASRIPYGTEVTPQRLAQVEAAEDALADLGFSGFRVRHHDQVARLEIPADQLNRLMDQEIREQVVTAVKRAGFVYAALDLEGFRSGSGNVMLTLAGRDLAAD